MTARKPRILIVDDHPVMRLGLRQLLTDSGEFEVCGEAGSAGEAAAILRESGLVDLVLLDIALPDKNGIELIREIRELDENVLCMVVSGHDENVYAERVLRAGARGYVMKNQAPRLLIDGVRRVIEGRVFVCENMMEKMIASLAGLGGGTSVSALTDRELEVFRLMGEGMNAKEIADQLHISVHTVDTHRGHIKEKMGLKDANETLHRAIQWVEAQN